MSLTKTGVVNLLGPHFSSFGMVKGNEYTIEYFKKALFESSPFEILFQMNGATMLGF